MVYAITYNIGFYDNNNNVVFACENRIVASDEMCLVAHIVLNILNV